MRILRNPWKEDFLRLVSESNKSIQITSPYIKEDICNDLIRVKKEQSKIEIYTSFKLMNIYSGSLDLAGLEKIISQNGIVKNFPKLHSKIYLFDNERVIITSGNLTNGGLLNNFEYGIYSEDISIINEVSKDFKSFEKNKDIGTVKLDDINVVKNLLSKIPKTQSIKLPKYDIKSSENKYDIMEISEDILTSSLKGWKLEVLKCVQSITNQEFNLDEINRFEPYLREKYPNNNHITDKIRQQLQFLRDYGLVEFLGNGKFKKLWK